MDGEPGRLQGSSRHRSGQQSSATGAPAPESDRGMLPAACLFRMMSASTCAPREISLRGSDMLRIVPVRAASFFACHQGTSMG